MKRLMLAGFAVLVAATLPAIEVQEGRLRLRLHEDTARFSLYLDTGDGWIPLLFPADPRTTALDILEGNRVHRMGDSGTFRQIAERSHDGARFVWTSPTLRVVQSFRFTRGADALLTDAVHMRIEVENRSEQPVRTGVRILYDTYLGEAQRTHLAASTGRRYAHETLLTPGSETRFIVSAPGPGAGHGLQIMLHDGSVTPPAGAVLANWNRLARSPWNYAVDERRSFSDAYSPEDSAVLVTYEPVVLAPGGRTAVTAALGNVAPEGYLDPHVAALTTEAGRFSARIDELIARIDAQLDAQQVSPAEVAELQLELETLSNLVHGR